MLTTSIGYEYTSFRDGANPYRFGLVGAAELTATWVDPGYDAAQSAFYYARVLANPTCCWSTWDAIRAGVAPKAGFAATLQERAWTSPIWIIR